MPDLHHIINNIMETSPIPGIDGKTVTQLIMQVYSRFVLASPKFLFYCIILLCLCCVFHTGGGDTATCAQKFGMGRQSESREHRRRGQPGAAGGQGVAWGHCSH